MSAIVERVAQEILAGHDWTSDVPSGPEGRNAPSRWEALSEDWKDAYRKMARAAVEAMRDPTEQMVIAGCRALNGAADELMGAHLSGDRHALARTKMRIRHRAMMDEALRASPTHQERAA